MEEFENFFIRSHAAFKQSRTAKRALELGYGLINCMGRHTITGMLTASGQQFKDWTANYRLFDGDRMDVGEMFSVIRKELINNQWPDPKPIYAHMDDTNTRKRGKRIAGTSWMRDPLGPPFHTNFIWGQRFIQLSVSLPAHSGAAPSRTIPIDFHHCPTIKKPKKSDDTRTWEVYKERRKMARLSQAGSNRINLLRENLDREGAQLRQLILSVDGSYTNETVIKQLPENTILIGRIRKDCCLYQLPEFSQYSVGRNRVYGTQLPSPEQIRQSDQYPWQEVVAWAAGKTHIFNVKIIRDIRWRKAGNKNLQLVVVRPLGYRLTQKSPMLYRRPAYLICTKSGLPIQQLLQAYLWRWGIEVNIRDEKSLLGCGQAQVRKQIPVEKIPAFCVAVYAFLLLADHKTSIQQKKYKLPRAKWYGLKTNQRTTTGDMLNQLRTQLWAKNMNINFSHFVNIQSAIKRLKKDVNPSFSTLFYARN
jgi:DDE superfamily endonuclease